MMKPYKCLIFLLLVCVGMPMAAQRRHMNDIVLNRPYADLRAWHLGFSVGMHTQNLLFTHNGHVTENGQSWQIEQPSYTPGFCVNGVASFRLSTYLSVRANPGLYFGNRDLKMLDSATGATERQSLKSTYVVLPFDLVYSSQRLRNFRPYVSGGVMGALDVSKKQSEFLQLKSTDIYLTVAFGADFYLQYFKFIPELKFCFGLVDVLQHRRPEFDDDPYKYQFTKSLKRVTSRMIVLTFYFE